MKSLRPCRQILKRVGRSGLLATFLATAAVASEPTDGAPSHPSTFLRGAYQAGAVLGTNDFLKGDNLAGQPIDSFQSVRLEFGWQTDGNRDWHHIYNFPAYGIGFLGADFFNDEELGNPTSLYGFFVWPVKRTNHWTFHLETAFGLTTNWKSYDPVNNPQNIALGLGRSVHIEFGANAEYHVTDRWSLIGGVSGTHFSNGGTQRPNHGLNQMGPVLFVKYHTDEPVRPPTRRDIGTPDTGWDLTVTGSAGKRNLNLKLTDPALRGDYLNRSYFVGNVTVGLGRKFSHKSRYVFGLDLGYDESVSDLIELEAYNNGYNDKGDTGDNFELALFAGYEIIAHRTHLLVHAAYKVLHKDVPGRLPEFYQRIGVKQFVYQDWFVGLNVRFHELGSADNLEWNLGYAVDL